MKIILSLTAVVAAVVSVLGNLVALYLKDYLGARSFERWKAREALVALLSKYSKPLSLAADELAGRCYSLSVSRSAWPRENVGLEMLKAKAKGGESAFSDYERYYRYRFISDVYRLCCFLGWIELYRRDLGVLDVGEEERNSKLEEYLWDFRGDLADGYINTNEDWDAWIDALVFREEQRAIGHKMIAPGPGIGMIDFGAFCKLLEADPSGTGSARWFIIAARFFSHLEKDKDFRLVRMSRLIVHLTDMREILTPAAVPPHHVASAKKLKDDLKKKGLFCRTPVGDRPRPPRSSRPDGWDR